MDKRLLSSQVLVISPGVMLDNYNASSMVESLVSARAGGVRFVIIDMARLEFISSAGVGALLGTVNTFRDQGGDLILCQVSPTVLHVLKVLDLDTYFTVRQSLEEAVTLTEAVPQS